MKVSFLNNNNKTHQLYCLLIFFHFYWFIYLFIHIIHKLQPQTHNKENSFHRFVWLRDISASDFITAAAIWLFLGFALHDGKIVLYEQ